MYLQYYRFYEGGIYLTAEIAILNKMAVALAADSAVTIGSDVNQKVYNSANKLFALSKYHPVGVMIYGGANFMGVPWEIIIKSYRKKLQNNKFDTLEEYVEDFLSFLIKDKRFCNATSERELIERICLASLTTILGNQVTNEINRLISNGEQVQNEYVSSLLENIITEKVNELQNLRDIIIYKDFDKEFNEIYSTVIEEIIGDLLNFEVTDILKSLIVQYTGLLVQKEIFADSFSGLVISGYGEEEIFPSLYEFHIEGIILGELKYIKRPTICIGSSNDEDHITAAMRPFAQKEMVHSFMNGVEPSLHSVYLQIFLHALTQHFDFLEDIIDKSKVNDWHILRDEHQEILMKSIESSVNEFQYDYFTQPIMNILDVLPKEEIAAMAEALVNLTSFKRKVTMDAETVGGPIDVAVITKGDGFVWIKRKHYFKPELNYQFFNNYLGGKNNGY